MDRLAAFIPLVIFPALLVVIAICAMSCGGYKPPEGMATAGTATEPQNFVSKPQIGVALDALKPGDRVWAMKNDACYYPAKVTKLINERYYVQFDDGEKGRLKREKLLQWWINPGMAVEFMQSDDVWIKAVVNSLAGENMTVQIGGGTILKVVSLMAVRIRSFPPS